MLEKFSLTKSLKVNLKTPCKKLIMNAISIFHFVPSCVYFYFMLFMPWSAQQCWQIWGPTRTTWYYLQWCIYYIQRALFTYEFGIIWWIGKCKSVLNYRKRSHSIWHQKDTIYTWNVERDTGPNSQFWSWRIEILHNVNFPIL